MIQYGYHEPPIEYFTFRPKDVMPYYDIYNNGSIVLYIKRKMFFGLYECITKVKDCDIHYNELPEKKVCR
jgi:hypothetical protein